MAVIVKGVTSSGGGAKIGSILNDDGTQSLIITDNGSVIDLSPMDAEINEQTNLIALIQTELDTKSESGGGTVTGISEPVLLWTNASPTSIYNGGTVSLDGDYDGFIIETKYSAFAADTVAHYKNIVFAGTVGGVIAASSGSSTSSGTVTLRPITEVTRNSISFGNGRNEGASYDGAQLCIPTRIWGVKFTL